MQRAQSKGGITDASEDKLKVVKDLNKSKYWILANKIKFNDEKWVVLYLGRWMSTMQIITDSAVVFVKRIWAS